MGILVEAVVEVIKSIFSDGKLNYTVLLSIGVGILFAFTLRVDLFQLLGIDVHITYVGTVLSGLVVSRGANFAHDLLDKLQGDK